MKLEVYCGKKGNEQVMLEVYEEALIEWWYTEDVRKKLEDPEIQFLSLSLTKQDWNNWCTYEAEQMFEQLPNPGYPQQEASQLLQKACDIMQMLYENESNYIVLTKDM